MAKRQPEGKIKDECRKLAEGAGLIFWQIEGKSRNGVPDTLASKTNGGAVFIEFKVPGKEPNEQQYLRIHELRSEGIEAWWTDSVEGYRRIVGLDPGGYRVSYPAHIVHLLELGTTADARDRRKVRSR